MSIVWVNLSLIEEQDTIYYTNKEDVCEPMSLLSIRGWWVRYVTMWDTTLQQLFNEVSMLGSCIDED